MRRIDYAKESAKLPAVVIACGYLGCPEHAITREFDNLPLCRTHWDQRFKERNLLALKAMNLVTLEEKQDYCRVFRRKMESHLNATPSRDWARKILERHEDGEYIPDYNVALAHRALR